MHTRSTHCAPLGTSVTTPTTHTSKEAVAAILNNVIDAVFILDREWRIIDLNRHAAALLQREGVDLLGSTIWAVFPGAIATEIKAQCQQALSTGVDVIFEIQNTTRRTWGEVQAHPATVGLIVSLRDITARKTTETALRTREASLTEAQRIAHLGSWEYDIGQDTLSWSDEMYRIAGHTPQSFLPTHEHLLTAIHPDDRPLIKSGLTTSLLGERPDGLDYRIIRPDKTVRVVHQRMEVIRDGEGQPLKQIGIILDITERRALERRLQHQASHDMLTNLPNRVLFLDRLRNAQHEGQPYAVLFLDLDRFKDVNDTLGHDTGDRLLIMITARLGDTLARQGGDEFTILLTEGVTISSAINTAKRILEALAVPLTLDGQEYRLTASIGIALERADHARPEAVLRDADIAMYRAKASGGGCYALFDPAMQAALATRVALERDLRQALEREEFVLHYQPIIHLHTGRIDKVEALIRWQHPTRGMISPGEFIPLAEETGIIAPLGRWVLEEACRQAATWGATGQAVVVAVNLTAREFQHPDLAEEVAAALTAAGLEARWLRLEITESLAMRDVAATITTLAALQALGVQVALDDFGTGYSSLAYLKRLPVDTLKIDKDFIDGLGIGEEDTAIVTAIIALAHTLGLVVIAEGVETVAQTDRLRALGCDLAQGYHFARPLPAAKVTTRLGHGEARVSALPPVPQRVTTGELHKRRTARTRRLLLPTGVPSASE
jgi:diguanylate cyclase (GGDEF)-like protein/PAS domain S-box-containing protein